MNAFSRRHALAGAIAVSAIAASALPLASPALAGAAQGPLTYPELARAFAAIYERWKASRAVDRAASQHFSDMLDAAGIDRDAMFNPGDKGLEDWLAAYKRVSNEHQRICPHPVNEHGESIMWNEIHGEMWPICEEIMRRPVRTLADLALQAQAAALMHADFWGDECTETGADAYVQLVQSICALVGIEPLPGVDLEA